MQKSSVFWSHETLTEMYTYKMWASELAYNT